MQNLFILHVRLNVTPAYHLIHMREHTNSTLLLSAELIRREMVARGLTVTKTGTVVCKVVNRTLSYSSGPQIVEGPLPRLGGKASTTCGRNYYIVSYVPHNEPDNERLIEAVKCPVYRISGVSLPACSPAVVALIEAADVFCSPCCRFVAPQASCCSPCCRFVGPVNVLL